MLGRAPHRFALSALAALAAGLLAPACSRPADSPPPLERAAGPHLAFTLAERDLLPENLAFDPITSSFFVGSTRKGKIVRVDADGNATDFTEPRQDGLWMILGMKVDLARRHLWVASSDGDNLEGYTRRRGRAAGLFQFDLESGSLIRKWTLEDAGSTHFFNDLVISESGNVYVTHMFNAPAVWVLAAGGEQLEIFVRPGGFNGPNGLDFGDDGLLYVAHREGVSAFDPATAERRLLADPRGWMATPADGLYFHRGSLVGLHPEEGVVRRYLLDEERTSIVGAELLAEDDPANDDPTTGVLVGDTLYYIANSQFGRLSNGRLPPVAQLDPVVVLELDLSR